MKKGKEKILKKKQTRTSETNSMTNELVYHKGFTLNFS